MVVLPYFGTIKTTMFTKRKTEHLHPPHTPGYFNKIANSSPNRPFRAAGSVVASFFAELKTGRLSIAKIPQATLEYEGPAIFAAVHRAKRDIPDDIKIINRAGFDSARPLAKEEWFSNKAKEMVFHGLGAFAVDRSSKFGLVGAVKASTKLIERGQNILIYEESTRIETDTRTVAEILGVSVMLAIKSRKLDISPVPVFVIATAGAAIDDEKHLYGFGTPLVGTISEPIYFAPSEGQSDNDAIRAGAPLLRSHMQNGLDLAYMIRDDLVS